MKCPKCNGTGIDYSREFIDTCDACEGCGHINPLTNEEYYFGGSTEKKARFLINLVYRGLPHELYQAIGRDKNEVIEWLKKVHE